MPAALSVDLRLRVVEAYKTEGLSYGEAAARFGVGYATVNRWLRLLRETQQLEAKPLPGRARRITREGDEIVRRLVREQPDATLKELADRYGSIEGRRLPVALMQRAVARLGLTLKKRSSTPVSAIATTSCSSDGTTNTSAPASAEGFSSSTKAV
jgi:putative transposase